ncbi:helix-turn-helix domain-containing protein [Nocardia beijingensis]|uniref:Excisionase family DNA-binding protein n=1 Tax=Nocardia abscessus TaxID=120957 RepID=A0ABS0CG76_9NOCA|nr:helix-turn-helix domain-containing protein [Nocardia abscessus]MBF6229347.1 excisionase family DNA-binding protein [Nocardia abscessus]
MTVALSAASSPEDLVPDDLIPASTAASLIHVDAKTIKNWIKTGDLRGWLVNGRHYRVRRSDVLSLVQPVAPFGGDR